MSTTRKPFEEMNKRQLVEALKNQTSHFEDDGIIITCNHVKKGTPAINFEGIAFNLGERSLLPCQRCYVALREAILGDAFVQAMANAIKSDPELRSMHKKMFEVQTVPPVTKKGNK